MKAIKLITHPFLLIASFLFLLISGEHFGGFYVTYLLLALPHGGIHAVLALVGIFLLIYSFYRYRRNYKYLIEPLINLVGLGCIIFSLFLFFYRDKQGYNDATFDQTAPQITIGLFGLLCVGFIFFNIVSIAKGPKNGNLSLKEA